jgi:hypothetical protein
MLEEILGIARSIDKSLQQRSLASPMTVYSLVVGEQVSRDETYKEEFPTLEERQEALNLLEKLSSRLRDAGSTIANPIKLLPVTMKAGRLRLELFSAPFLEDFAVVTIINDLLSVSDDVDFGVILRTSKPISFDDGE